MKHLQEVKYLIFNSTIDQSLELAAYLIRDVNSNYCYYLDLTDIEEYLIEKISSLITMKFNIKNVAENDPLFVISEGYSTGGHTRLMENLSLMMSSKCDLLITRPTQEVVIKKFENYFGDIFTCFKSSDAIEYIIELIKNIIKYENVILNTHPDDIFTIIACGIAKKINKNLKIYFVNHADHLATYGVTISDVWFGVSLYGQILDRARGFSLETKASFLGIPINKPDSNFFRKIVYRYNGNGSKFLTAATGHKYNSSQGQSIAPLLEKILLDNPKNELAVIGSGVDSNRSFVMLKKNYPKRLVFHPSLPHEKYIDLTAKAEFYIDSFPIPGGTAFVEQFIHGKPCIGLQTNFFGYTPLELLKGNSVDEVLDLLRSPPSTIEIDDIQFKVFEVHSFTKVKIRFISSIYESVYYGNPMLNYINEKDILKNYDFKVSKDLLKYIYSVNKISFLKLVFSREIFDRAVLKYIKQ